jgi:TetR/AcrR family transcriptional regulator of autoinduction and epiphytic fitness
MTKRIITTRIIDLVQIKIKKSKLLCAVYLFLLKSKLDSVVYIHVSNIFKLGLMEKALTLTEKKRLSILAAAQEEFKEKGFLGASMDSLAKRAEVSKRTVYNHFPSKDILFHNIVKQLCDSFSQAVNIKYQVNEPLDKQLYIAAVREIQLLESECFRDLNLITLAEFIRSPELASSTLEHLAQQKDGLHVWINDATSDGRLNVVDADYAAQQFLGLIKASAFWPQLFMKQAFPSAEQQKIIADDAVLMFLARYEI